MGAMADLILKEGWRPIGIAVGAALLFAIFGFELLSFFALVGAIALVRTYRRPVRSVSHFEKGSVTSPCDGTVTLIETASDGGIVVEIETGCLDGSMLTMPFDGTCVHCSLVRGARLPRRSPLFALLNEHATMMMETAGGKLVTITHAMYRAPAPLIIDDVSSEKKRSHASRYGILVQGLTRVHLPASTRVAVNPGEKVFATETLLGYMG